MMIYGDLAHIAGRGKTVLKVRLGDKVQMNPPQLSTPLNDSCFSQLDNAVLLQQGAGMWGEWIPEEVPGGQRGCEMFCVNMFHNMDWYFRQFLALFWHNSGCGKILERPKGNKRYVQSKLLSWKLEASDILAFSQRLEFRILASWSRVIVKCHISCLFLMLLKLLPVSS